MLMDKNDNDNDNDGVHGLGTFLLAQSTYFICLADKKDDKMTR